MNLSDLGSWASIIGLVITIFGLFFIVKTVYNFFTNKNKQENKVTSIFNSGSISQTNKSNQNNDSTKHD